MTVTAAVVTGGLWRLMPYANGAIVVNVGSIISNWTGWGAEGNAPPRCRSRIRRLLRRQRGVGNAVADCPYQELLLGRC